MYSKKIPYLRFPVYLKNEEEKRNICNEYKRVGISSMYPGPINTINEIQGAIGNSLCPASAMIARKLVTLPTHSFVDGILRKEICSVISNSLDNGFQNSGQI
jgi:hypothetical protein